MMIGQIFSILVGAGMVLFSLFRFAENYYLKKNGIETDATIVKSELRRVRWFEVWKHEWWGDTHSSENRNIVTFSYIIDGIEYIKRYTTDHVDDEPYYLSGETVRIYYDKNNPNKIIISQNKQRTMSNIISIIAGILIIMIGVGYF